jgi:endonuclease G
LEKGLDAARKVAFVDHPTEPATGFLVGEDIFMTNNHVFQDEEDAVRAKLVFNFRKLKDGSDGQVDIWECDPDRLFKTDEGLDYTIVGVKRKHERTPGQVYEYFNLRHGSTVKRKARVSIIQHPRGRLQEIAFRDNQVEYVNINDGIIQYITDTQKGSSGSPVLDDAFNVIALHCQYVPDPDDPAGKAYRNEGFLISSIVNHAGELIP